MVLYLNTHSHTPLILKTLLDAREMQWATEKRSRQHYKARLKIFTFEMQTKSQCYKMNASSSNPPLLPMDMPRCFLRPEVPIKYKQKSFTKKPNNGYAHLVKFEIHLHSLDLAKKKFFNCTCLCQTSSALSGENLPVCNITLLVLAMLCNILPP